jgi:transposase/DNA-binding transcriptional regulator YiaG
LGRAGKVQKNRHKKMPVFLRPRSWKLERKVIKHKKKELSRMELDNTRLNVWSSLSQEDYYIYNQNEDNTAIHLYIKSKKNTCNCPKCGVLSKRLHSTYERTLQDTPINCKQTILHISAHKYDCQNTECSYKVFSEPLPFVKKNQVRTNALTYLILCVASFLGNETASQVLKLLGVFVSNDTIQRIYDSLTFKDDLDVEEIGIDDVAIRKGQKYATAIYDLKDHSLIELLEGRDGETLKKWLKNRPKIRLVARDRASAYAAAIDELLPDCVQVADRFHLLQNAMNHLKDIFKDKVPSEIFIKDGAVLDEKPTLIASYKKPNEDVLEALKYDNTPPVGEDGKAVGFDGKHRDLDSLQYKAHAEKRQAKQQIISTLQERSKKMEANQIKILAEEFQMSPPTVKKYLNMTEEDIQKLDQPNNYKKRITIMDDYLNMIYKMLGDNIDEEIIYAYVCYKGYSGNPESLRKYIYQLKKNNFPNRKSINPLYNMVWQYPDGVLRFKRTELLKYLLTCNPKTKTDPLITANIDTISLKYPCVDTVKDIFHQFYDVIMGQDPKALDIFITKYQDSAISSFCTSIKKDITPVKNAISLNVSSGFVEGNNNKFKLIKRIVYGRASLVNLAKKCKLAFSFKIPDFHLYNLL